MRCDGLMVLAHRTPDREALVRALAGIICVVFLGKTLYSSSASLSTQGPAQCWGVADDGLESHAGGVAILLANLLCKQGYTLSGTSGPLGS